MAVVSIGTLFMSSCASTGSYTNTQYSYSEYRQIQSGQSVTTIPVVANLVVSEKKINYAERIEVDIRKKSPAEAKALADKEKETVLANAASANKADVIVAPIINIQTDTNGYLVIAVSGYPAIYEKFRNITSGDIELLKLQTPPVEQGEKKRAMPIALPNKKN